MRGSASTHSIGARPRSFVASYIAHAAAAAAMATPLGAAWSLPTLSLHRDSVRFDLSSGAALDGVPEDAAVLAAPLRLRAVRDEVVALQVVVAGREGRFPIAVTGAPGLEITVLAARGVPHGGRVYPDALVPTATVSVPAPPGIAVLWLDLWASPEVAAGVARAELRVGDASAVVIEVDVIDRPLGPLPGFGARASGPAWSEAKLRAWSQVLHAHGVDLEVEAATELTRSLASGRLFTADAGYRGPRAGAPAPRARVPIPAGADEEAWARAIEAFAQGAEGPEWVVSAPPLTDAASVERTIAWGRRLDTLPPEIRRRVVFRVSDAFGRGFAGLGDAQIARALSPVVDEWLVTGSVEKSPWNVLEAEREADHDLKILFHSGPDAGPPATPALAVDVDLANARAWGWVAHAYHLTGAIVDGLDAHGGCLADPPCGGARPLESALVWRGEDLGLEVDAPYASIRLKALRRGAQDAALLGLLDAQDADTGRALADIMVPMALGDEQPDSIAPPWPVSAVAYDRARDQILDRLTGARPDSIAAVRPEAPVDPVRRSGGWAVVLGGAAVVLFLIARGAARASKT